MSVDPRARAAALQAFVDWCDQHIRGDEKGEAQIFLDRLFQAFGQRGSLEVGGRPEFRVRKAADSGGGVSFADFVWKPVVLVEMKRRGANLAKHYRQAFDYWVRLVPERPTYVVLCNFDEFWIYDFNRQMDTPVDVVQLADLPTRFGALAFLFPQREAPIFGNDQTTVTAEAASTLAEVYRSLVARGQPQELAQRFTLQTLVALFAEDIGLMPKYALTRALADCKAGASGHDLLGDLFTWMNTPGGATGGRYLGVPYFNGGLFSSPSRLELALAEVDLLRRAAEFNWSKVRPEVFGSLFEASLAERERHAYGAHFTSPADIMKIVGPTITNPWRQQIEEARSVAQLDALHDRLVRFRVLDPACGSGNFLYVAYREIKRLEADILQKRASLLRSARRHQRSLGFVSVQRFYGIDVNPFAVELAKVTLVIAHKLVIDELALQEQALPFDNLDRNFIAGDALIGEDGMIRPWPAADVVIGNPPFLGAKRLKPERGVEYVNTLRKLYRGVPAMADYCVYWIQRAHEHLPACTATEPVSGRAGLVGTQNIRSNQSRTGGLDHVVATGTIIEAVDNQPWSGDAAVHVSIVNWIKTQDPAIVPSDRRIWSSHARRSDAGQVSDGIHAEYELIPRKVSSISASLAETRATPARATRTLTCNQQPKRCFQGKIPGYEGFVIDSTLAADLRRDCGDVVVPYLTGRELLDQFRIERWVIDFGGRSMLEARQYNRAFEHCQTTVLPMVQKSWRDAVERGSDMCASRKEHLERWWQFWNRRDELSATLRKIPRYIACSRVTRRPILAFVSSNITPSDLVQVFAFADDYSFAILQSRVHLAWFRERSSRLKIERDMRYGVREVFETFPWPQGDSFLGPSTETIDRVAAAARNLRATRDRALSRIPGGLRALYKTLELPGKNELREAHDHLDNEVDRAYGISSSIDSVDFAATLNATISARLDANEIVTGPGVPSRYPTPEHLVSIDCFSLQEIPEK